jgi:16S rRNA (cytidine1402-2'-O)-methyltransferase
MQKNRLARGPRAGAIRRCGRADRLRPADGQLFFRRISASQAGAAAQASAGDTAVPATLVFYEAPHRVLATLADMVEIFGERQACLARELTKIHEEWLRGTLSEIAVNLHARTQIRGEITLVVDRGVSAPQAQVSWPASIGQHLEAEMRRTGSSRKEALKAIARQRGISRKDAYRHLLLDKKTLL